MASLDHYTLNELMSRGWSYPIKGAISSVGGSTSSNVNSTTIFDDDGSSTTTYDDGRSETTVFNDDSSVVTTYSLDGTIQQTKTTVFNDDGSVSTTYAKGGDSDELGRSRKD